MNLDRIERMFEDGIVDMSLLTHDYREPVAVDTPKEWISRQTKCNQCAYNADLSCSDKKCFPANRADKRNVYFVR